jgi:UDP-N-acetylmuramoyl-tripeptide--D-alanyl-D-alanine ligase
LEDTRREKVKMIQGLTSEGMAILNGDDPNVKWMASQTKARVKTIGMDPTNDVWASEVELNWPR